jgi:PAS domain S-box-containing protein
MNIGAARYPRANQKTRSDNAVSANHLHKDKGFVNQCNDEYKYLFDNTSDAIRVINNDFTIRRINQSFADITGVDKNDVAGRKCWEVFPSPHCHTQECRLRRILNGENQIQVEIERQKKDGATISCIVTTSRLQNETGRLTGIMEQFRDITDKKQAENKILESEALYRDLFQHVPVAIAENDFSQAKKYYDQLKANEIVNFREHFVNNVSDEMLNYEIQPRLTRINNQALRLWGVSSAEEYNKFMLQRHGKLMEGPRESTIGLAEGKTYFDFEGFVQTPKGEMKYLHTWIAVAPGCENSLSKVYVCFVDDTARKKAEKELIKYKDHLEDMVKTRTKALNTAQRGLKALLKREMDLRCQVETQMQERTIFMRSIAHELRTPLTALLAASDLLLENIHTGSSKILAEQVNEGALELGERINELFDLARGEIGMLKLRNDEISIKNIFEKTIKYFTTEAQKKGIELDNDWPAHLPYINGDSQRITQILYNLIENALKCTSKKGKITLRAKTKEHHLLVSVEDTGCGIPIENQTELFKDYHRQNTQNSDRGGMGLGLSLSKMLVELHGGKIWVESEGKGKGSKFFFTLPYSDNTRNCA